MGAQPARLSPPFSQKTTSTPSGEPVRVIHPAAIPVVDDLVRPVDDLKTYLQADLVPHKLDFIYRHLHLAGRPRFARPLHRQKLLGRTITITEDVSEHLVWHHSRIFIKPLPAYLLDHGFWTDNLCEDLNLHQAACGFLLSYAWLVSRESDFRLARDEMHLLPNALEWETWAAFMTSFTGHIDTKTLHQVARRYEYGELRLSRLNKIYRYMPIAFSTKNFVAGFLSPSTWYQELFRQSFGWLLAVFAFFSVSLSGLQVGLATNHLGQDGDFHEASYGFTVFSLVTLAASVVAMMFTWVLLTMYHFTTSELYHHRVQSWRRKRRREMEGGGEM
ncbi:hypothetical protein B0T14DRAFT_501707 [Immersiella caudata]|uniref:Subtilisin-like serine protease n=1 Tax=Immersiella caudata TaxID=314043 RepID=A0AA39XCK8_9PEZI|nr:hypothetical protein B0T14DRAFT_501707 [Immersiella caudata]